MTMRSILMGLLRSAVSKIKNQEIDRAVYRSGKEKHECTNMETVRITN